MAESLISRKYAKALLAAADEQGKLTGTLSEVTNLEQVIRDCQVAPFFQSQVVTDEAKHNVLALLIEEASPLLVNFLKVLEENGRLSLLLDSLLSFEKLADSTLGRSEVEVTTPIPISEVQKQKMLSLIKTKFALKDVTISNKVDEKILGGFVIKNEEKVLDASIKSQLAEIAKQL